MEASNPMSTFHEQAMSFVYQQIASTAGAI
jgi:hypothetical protein